MDARDPDAHHLFDMPAVAQVVRVEQGLSPRGCRLVESEGGAAVRLSDPCLERGVTLYYNEAATKKTPASSRF